jgi:hypothetical protein
LHPDRRESWEGAFNAQTGRQRIFADLVRNLGIEEIVETGTFRGATTEFMHRQSGLPIRSVEFASRLFGYASARLLRYPKVRLSRGDSRAFLRLRLRDDRFRQRKLLFYLDAHWERDVPLPEEVSIIFDRAQQAAVLIDDFEVPSDPGYRFDDYGPGKRLSLPLLGLSRWSDVAVFFPTLPSAEETGARRGCVVLCRTAPWIGLLDGVPSLRRHRP